MKRIIAALLTLCLLGIAAAAAADTPINNDVMTYKGPLSSYVPAREYDFGSNWKTYFVEQEDQAGAPGQTIPDYEATYAGGSLAALEIEIELPDGTEYEVAYDKNKKITRAEYEEGDTEIYFDGTAWHDAAGNPVTGPDLTFMGAYFDAYVLDGVWFPNNTMSLVGLPLRDLVPGLTTRWYHVVPVDLTKEGTFRYGTAISNMYWFGSCTVTIKDGTVTTDYAVSGEYAYPKADCLMWFTDLSEITTEFLEAPIGKYQFGQPVSIQNDLKGKKIALLFICNRITYRQPATSWGGFLIEYYPNIKEVRDMRDEYMALLNQMQQ